MGKKLLVVIPRSPNGIKYPLVVRYKSENGGWRCPQSCKFMASEFRDLLTHIESWKIKKASSDSTTKRKCLSHYPWYST